MKTAPFLSICVLTYRRTRTLVETLDSLLGQLAGHSEVEVVVCDNASGDDTAELVASYQAQHPQLRYHCNENNLGFNGNVVTCVQQGAGEYVAFFSDDDIAPPGHVEFLLGILHEKRPVVLYLNHQPFFHNDPRQIAAPASPQQDFDAPTGGEEFFFLAGMGFISALILARQPALETLPQLVDDPGEPHVGLGGRLALSKRGLCLYRGSYSVYARVDSNGAPILIGGCVNLAKLYWRFVQQGLLSRASYDYWLAHQIRSTLPHQVVATRARRKGVYPLGAMRDLYGHIPSFYFWVLPLYLIPTPLLAASYACARWLKLTCRRLGYALSGG